MERRVELSRVMRSGQILWVTGQDFLYCCSTVLPLQRLVNYRDLTNSLVRQSVFSQDRVEAIHTTTQVVLLSP